MPSDGHRAEPRRLHPASLLFSLLSLARAFIIPGLVLLAAGRGHGPELTLMFLALPALAMAVAKYLSLRYQLTETELIVQEGILKRNERHIPFERIQNIDTTRNVLHRLLGVADVNVQTASGSKPEAKLQVLSLDAIQAMRDHVFSRQRRSQRESDPAAGPADSRQAPDSMAPESMAPESMAPESMAPESMDQAGSRPLPGAGDLAGVATRGRLIARLGIPDLLVLGIISNRGMVALAAVLGLLSQVDIMPSQQQLEELTRSIPGIQQWSLAHTVTLFVLAVAVGIVLLRLLSMLWAVLALYGFTLHRDEDELRSHFGLLTQRTATIPRHRIQIVQIESGVLHRVFGRVTVRARTAGSGTELESGLRQDWLAPLIRTSQLRALLVETHPGLDPETLEWQALPKRAIRRLRWRLLLALAPAATVITGVAWPSALVAWPSARIAWPSIAAVWLLVAVAAWQVPIRRHRHMMWSIGSEALWFRSGWLRRTTRVVRFSKMQVIGTVESPFDRRHSMRTLTIDAANAGTGRHAIAIRFLPEATAVAIAAYLRDKASETRFRW